MSLKATGTCGCTCPATRPWSLPGLPSAACPHLLLPSLPSPPHAPPLGPACRPVPHAVLRWGRVCAGPRGGGPRVQVRAGGLEELPLQAWPQRWLQHTRACRQAWPFSLSQPPPRPSPSPPTPTVSTPLTRPPWFARPLPPRVMYDRATMLWTLLWKIVKCHPRMKKLQGERAQSGACWAVLCICGRPACEGTRRPDAFSATAVPPL